MTNDYSMLTTAQLRAQIEAEIASPAPLPPWAIYTTAAELRFVENLRRKGNRVALTHLLSLVDRRHWTGEGMAVDVAEVRRALVLALGGGEA